MKIKQHPRSIFITYKSEGTHINYVLIPKRDSKMSVKDQIKIDIVSWGYFQISKFIEAIEIVIQHIYFEGMGSWAPRSGSTNSRTATVWCGIVVGAGSGGSEPSCQRGALTLRVFGRCFSHNRQILEDFYRTRDEGEKFRTSWKGKKNCFFHWFRIDNRKILIYFIWTLIWNLDFLSFFFYSNSYSKDA